METELFRRPIPDLKALLDLIRQLVKRDIALETPFVTDADGWQFHTASVIQIDDDDGSQSVHIRLLHRRIDAATGGGTE